MNWLRIPPVNLQLSDYITIAKAKTVNLSRGFIVKNNLDAKKDRYAVFLYDPQKNKLALAIKTAKSSDSFTISFSRNMYGGKISCHRMFRRFNINHLDNVGRFTYEVIDDSREGKLYVITLKAPTK